MSFKRAHVEQNQRTDVLDFNNTNDWSFANLALIARYFISGAGGVVRGGDLQPTAIPSMAVVLKAPLAAIVNEFFLALVETDQNLALAPANPSNPRIDLVSLGFKQDTVTASRVFIDQVTGNPTNQNTPVEYDVTADVVVTTGTPSATPSAPAPPAGYLPLWQITVPAAATSVTLANFQRAAPRAPGVDIRVAAFPANDVHSNQLNPEFTTADLLKNIDTPAGGITLLIGQIHLFAAAPTLTTFPLRGTIVGALGGNVGWGTNWFTDVANQVQTQTLIGVVAGPIIDTYHMHFEVPGPEVAQLYTPWDPAAFNRLIAITLPVRA